MKTRIQIVWILGVILLTSGVAHADRLSAPLAEPAQRGALERILTAIVYGLGIWVVAHVVLRWSGILLSEYTLALMSRSDFEPDFQRSVKLRLLSRLYRVLIILLVLYFYASLIFAVVLFTGWLVGSLIQVSSADWRRPLLIGVISYFSWSSLWRVFRVRINEKPQGHLLSRAEAPQLWGAVEEVARRVGARPVDRVYLVPEPVVRVYSLGSWGEQLRGQGQLGLDLGVAALSRLTSTQLKTILAHEYGHVVGGDVAGGQVAQRVKVALFEMVRTFRQHGQSVWFNPVWLFLSYYAEVFLRVSLGASQLQEAAADRLAARAYGGANLNAALTRVIRQSIEFEAQVATEIALAREEKRELRNLWQLPAILPGYERSALESRIGWAFNHWALPYDTHPGAARRIEWVAKIAPETPVEEDTASVAGWLPECEKLQAEMTALVQRRVFFQDALKSSAPVQRSQKPLNGVVEPKSAWEITTIPDGQQPWRGLRYLRLALMVAFVVVTVPDMEAAPSLQVTYTRVALLLLAGLIGVSWLRLILGQWHGRLVSAVWLWNHQEFDQAVELLHDTRLNQRAARLLGDMQDQLGARGQAPERLMLTYELD